MYFQAVLYEYVCVIAVNCFQIKFFELSIVDMRSEGSNDFVYSLVVSSWTIDWVKVCLNVLLHPTCWCKMRRIERLVVLPSSLTMNIVVEAKLCASHLKNLVHNRLSSFPKISQQRFYSFWFHKNQLLLHLSMENIFDLFLHSLKGEFVISKTFKNFKCVLNLFIHTFDDFQMIFNQLKFGD